jgi:hypothetical protein
MKTSIILAALLTTGLSSTSALAIKVDMAPGLWEHSFSINSQSGQMEQAFKQMQEQLAKMSPEERKMMEDMMAAQGIGISSDGAVTKVKVCMTQEEIDKGDLPQPDEDCKQEILEQTKNTFKIKFSCATNPPSSGTGEVVFSNPKNYSGKSTFVTEVDGKKETMGMTQNGKWLSADCGHIKPVSSSAD